jgi:putative glutamine amidotransferase
MALPPLVGLPTDRKQIGPHPFLAVGEKYVRAVVDGAGATPVLLPTLQPPVAVDDWLGRLDGLLLTGAASNIEPHHYTDEPSYEGNLHDPARDATTLGLIPRAVALGLPVLAICRGFQEVNVAFGGSLFQKLQEATGFADHRENPDDPLDVQYGPSHPVRLAEGGLLAGIAGGTRAQVNSLHGQGVARLGTGLVVEATAPDGAIEAVRRDGGGFLLGVQWHPEWQVLHNPFYLGIFHAFGDACRAYAARRAAIPRAGLTEHA